MEKVHSKLAKRRPDQSVILQRLPQIIRANGELIIGHWLQSVKQDPEIGSIPIPDSERRQHVLLLLDIATGVAEGVPIPKV
jgi:hypothetical protein